MRCGGIHAFSSAEVARCMYSVTAHHSRATAGRGAPVGAVVAPPEVGRVLHDNVHVLPLLIHVARACFIRLHLCLSKQATKKLPAITHVFFEMLSGQKPIVSGYSFLREHLQIVHHRNLAASSDSGDVAMHVYLSNLGCSV